jgi:hypothetical protein
VVALSVAAIYLLWRNGLGNFGAIAAGLGATIFARSAYRSKLYKNPLGDDRVYSVRLAVPAALKCMGCFVAALAWTTINVTAVSFKVLPDSQLVVYGLMLIPMIALISLGAMYFARALSTLQFGSKK